MDETELADVVDQVRALVEERYGASVRARTSDAFAGHGWPPPRFLDAWPSDGASRLR